MPGNIVNLTPETIASWPQPNYVDPVQRTWMPIYAGTIYGISTLMVAVRLWLRVLKQAGGLGLDDALLTFSWLGSSMFTTVLILSCTAYDTDRHAWDIPLQNFEMITLLAWLAQFSSLVTGCATKVSVLCFYRRLVAGTYSKRWKWAVIVAILFTSAWTLAFLLMLVFNCRPTEAYWKAFDLNWQHPYKCADTTVINLLAGIFAAVSDLYAVALPCLMTAHFQLPRRQKIALNLIFSLGLLVVAASGVRTYYMYQVGFNSDVSWMMFDAYVWAQLELQLSIICASLPALRVFLRRYLAEPFSRAGHSGLDYRFSQKSPAFDNIDIRTISSPINFTHLSGDEARRMEREGYHYDGGGGGTAYGAGTKESRKSHVPSTIEEVTTVTGSEYEMRSRSPSAPSEAQLYKGFDHTSESYNMSILDGYDERSIHSPSFERTKSSKGRNNFSQPFAKEWGFFDG